MKKISTLLFFIFSISLFGQIFPKNNSILASGDVYKIGIQKSGIYKLTKKNLEDLGINANNINPKQLSIYGNYGGTLPEAISQSYPDDFIEFPIVISGEEDGKFNDNDFILFYAEGADKWKFESSINDFHFDKNIYSDKNFVYLKVGTSDGKRVLSKNIEDASPTFITKSGIAYEVIHEDKTNLLGLNLATHGSGKLWVGEYVPSNQQKDLSSQLNFKGIDNSKPIKIRSNATLRSGQDSKFSISVDGKSFNTNASSVSLTGNEVIYARNSFLNFSTIVNSAQPKIIMSHTANDAWLDYLEISYTQNLSTNNTPMFIRNGAFAQNKYSSLEIAGSNTLLWDVSDLSNISSYKIKNSKANVETGLKDQVFLLFQESNASSPELLGKVKNQNLHSITDAEMVIVYHENFKAAAEKLAKHRNEISKLKVATVNVAEIYNEFSSGKLDPSAIRNFAKMLYDRSSQFKYLLLFGDGSYDYKALVKNVPVQNFIPVYETDESLDPINAFPTDDYYALLGNNEGASLRGAIDINVGRLTVNNVEDANAVVNKIIGYDTNPKRFGEWRLNSGFVADDEDNSNHSEDADDIAQQSFANYPLYNQQKVYIDAYRQENTPGGERFPDATEAINRNIEKGQLTWCYLGHGGPKGLAQERVVKLTDIEGWNNENTPTLFVTATCSFAGYDDPSITTGGELALANPKGGAIGLLTTVRSVYASDNYRLTLNVFKNLYNKENGLGLTLGEIIRRAKNATFADTTGDNSRKFTLLGDPSQKLALPEHDIVITKINNTVTESFKDTIGALEKLVFEGEIRNYQAQLVNDFTGVLSMTMFDKKSTLKTLGNDKSSSPIMPFDIYKNIIFKGQAQVTNGKFKIECFIPKDINYETGNVRISLYANTNVTDAAGYFNNLIVGGATLTNVKDDNPPLMNVYINDDKFVYGGITNSNPDLFIKLEDDFGINITGNSIGHDITARITGNDLDEEYILNDFYKASSNNFRAGEVRFPLSKLKSGLYTAKVKAWDISNNSVEGLTEFRVVDGSSEKLQRVINFPNPFVNNTNFSFEHDLANTDIELQLNIYTITGKLIKSITQNVFSSGNRVSDIYWDGKDDFGSNLARGVYIYRIIMNAPELKLKRESDFGKIVKM